MGMKDLDWSDIADRAEWTFAQAFFSVAGAAGTGFVSVKIWQSAAISGGAAVISMLKNIFLQAKEDPYEPPDANLP